MYNPCAAWEIYLENTKVLIILSGAETVVSRENWLNTMLNASLRYWIMGRYDIVSVEWAGLCSPGIWFGLTL